MKFSRIIGVILFLSFPSLKAADITVSWTHPTQYNDASPLAVEAIKETTVQLGSCTTSTPPGFNVMSKEVVVPGPASSVVIPGIVAGTYCFRAKTTDTAARVSAWSATVQKAIVDIKPKAPQTVTIQLGSVAVVTP